MSKFRRTRKKLNFPPVYDMRITNATMEKEIMRSKKEGVENPKVIAFPFIIFWKRKLKDKKWVRGVFRIFEVRYDMEKRKFTVVSIIQAPGIYQQFHRYYYFGKLNPIVQIQSIRIEGENPRFVCRFGFEEPERWLNNEADDLKPFIAGDLIEVENRPWVELHLYFDKSNMFYNQGFYFSDWCAKTVLSSLGIGFFGGLIQYFAFGLIYEGLLNAIFAVKPLVRTAGMIFRSIKKEFNGD